jgi:exosortase F-associated protein
MKIIIRILIILVLFGLFVVLFLVRAFEDQLFYDPLNSYFQNDYLYKKIPLLDRWNLLLHLFYRYTANSLISLAIIHMVFRNKKIIKFSQLFFTISFLLLIIAFFFSLRNNLEGGYLFTFYIRRFLIQPLFLLILLPAFYYHKKL